MLSHPDLNLIAQSNAGTETDHQTPVAQRRSIITVNASSCHWPIGDPRSPSFYFCGARTDGKTVYCERHAQLAIRPASSSQPKWKVA